MDILARIAALGGAARFSELDSSRYRLATLVASGSLEQLDRGGYALPTAPRPIRVAVGLNGAVSCVSALRELGYDMPGDASVVHCSVPRHRGRKAPLPVGVRRHFETFAPGDLPRRVSLVSAAARAAVCLPYDDAVVALDRVTHAADGALRSDVVAAVGRISRSRAAALDVDVDGRSRSRIETEARLALRRAGLRVAAGVDVPGVGEVDLLVEGVLIVELDGYAFHSDRRTFRRDRSRARTALRLGLPTARFSYEDSDPAHVVAEVVALLRALDAGPSRPDPSLSGPILAAVDAVRTAATGPTSAAQGWPHLGAVDRRRLRWLADSDPPR
ncbi:hypothetical protein C8046_09575 [Serinibacter arcticus]|uniref:DUF559 domain-containing protein n=1 Tax=Serinibacter arcticus TaxID=1655435 RepID=A0A2U1ZV65_9MICO|nr:hypothetical protein [Serinibacter arcticus]PWD50864.1 hypothetical protein C8046_09575 [Serinibacter arcticus]